MGLPKPQISGVEDSFLGFNHHLNIYPALCTKKNEKQATNKNMQFHCEFF